MKARERKYPYFTMRDFFCCSKHFYIRFEFRCNECCACSSSVSINITTVVQVDKLVTENRHTCVDKSIDNTAIATFFIVKLFRSGIPGFQTFRTSFPTFFSVDLTNLSLFIFHISANASISFCLQIELFKN